MNSKRSTGIVFYLFSRIFLGIAACAIVIPAAYLPIYKARIVSIIETQGQAFASTLLAVKGEDLYLEDYFSVIEYTQNVLKTTPEIEYVKIRKHGEPGFGVGPRQWTMLSEVDGAVSPKLPGQSLQHIENEADYFALSVPVVISNYDWGTLEVRLSSSTYNDILSDYHFHYSILAIGIILGVLVLMYASSRPIVRQLHTLRESANQVATGAMGTRVEENGIGELRSLSASFNEMAKALEEKTDHIEQLANVVEETKDGFIIFDPDYATIFTNNTFELLVEETGHPLPTDISQAIDLFQCNMPIEAQLGSYDFKSLECDALLKGSRPPKHVEISLQKMLGNRGRHQFVLSTSDITSRKDLESRLNDLAYYDKLSGLPNRRLFTSALEDELNKESKFVVLFMDLDNFKVINDSLGHDAGDMVINSVGQRLRTCLRDDDLLARIGGDEFTAILANAPNTDSTTEICQRIIQEISEPLAYENRELRLGISIGAVRVPEDANSVSDILKFADAAMYDAKQSGKMNYSFFSSNMLQRMVDVLNTEEALRKAMDRNELAAYYQPVFDGEGNVVLAEALIRWPSLDIPPQEFLNIAERSDLVSQLDYWVMQQGLAQLAFWHNEGVGLPLSLNVSPRTLQKHGFADRILSMLREKDLPTQLVQLEVTESILLDTDSPALQNLQHLRHSGIKIALDDFGTGYSSLSSLKNLTIDTLKLDSTFVAQCHSDSNSGIVASAIIDMSNRLGLITVAEGVESEAQRAWLNNAGCTAMQGFFLGEPVPGSEFAQHWLSKAKVIDQEVIDQVS